MSPEKKFRPDEILKEINHFAREYPVEFKLACDLQNYDTGERTFLGWNGLSWPECQVLRGAVNVQIDSLKAEEREIFNTVRSLFGELELGASRFQKKGEKNAA